LKSGIGVRVVLSDDPVEITLKNLTISGVKDGIAISHIQTPHRVPDHKINIDGSQISNIGRDAIILRDVGEYSITNNTIHSIHPNYEPYPYASLGKESSAANAAVILPDGKRTKAEHADGIQIANGKGGVIRGNQLSIGNGTWYQAINVHHEANSPYRQQSTIKVEVINNSIENNHDFAAQVCHYGEVDAKKKNNHVNSLPLSNRKIEENLDFKTECRSNKK